MPVRAESCQRTIGNGDSAPAARRPGLAAADPFDDFAGPAAVWTWASVSELAAAAALVADVFARAGGAGGGVVAGVACRVGRIGHGESLVGW